MLKRVLRRRSFALRGGTPRFPSARQRSKAAKLPFVTGSFGSDTSRWAAIVSAAGSSRPVVDISNSRLQSPSS